MKHPWLKRSMVPAALVLGLGVWQAHWGEYLLHLASHQVYVWSHSETIEEAQTREKDPQKKKRFELIARIKEFGKELYRLDESKSYSEYVQLPRDTLAWNITLAPALELKPKEFYFVIGHFSYLGFFDRELLDKWKKRFTSKGYDIYESEVAAYSTLGYLTDPLFSSYLNFSEAQLVRLILHEMSHEKLYFKDDSNFSESLSSFIEIEAARRFLKKEGKTPASVPQKSLALQEYQKFYEVVDQLREELEALYASELPDAEKLAQKAKLVGAFRKRLETLQKEFHHNNGPQWMLDLPEINNAVLIQIKRYSGHRLDAFRKLLKEECKDDILCWFEKLKALKPCDSEQRAQFMRGEVAWEEVTGMCDAKP